MQADIESPSARFWGYGAALVALALGCAFLSAIPSVTGGETLFFSLAWVPALGISFGFMLDGLALIFALLISLIGALIFLYATGYMGAHPRFRRFVVYLLAFMVSMLGLVLAGDLITLFLFWEMTSVTSYLLIGFDNHNARARRNALQALLVTAIGGLAMLAGFILVGMSTGSLDLAEILSGPGLQQSGLYAPILILVLLGAFTKSAQFPFHFWLPNAMAAPTPVSAYLHSATMVKAGVYLLARFHPVLAGTTAWVAILTAAGLTTAVMASILALRQTDLKQALAYTTLMALGTITLFLAGGSAYALTAAITFLIVHSLYKAALFMVVGAIDHGTGTRDIAHLGGLGRAMPITAAAALVSGASMAGLPPLFGWIGKEMLYAGAATMNWPVLVTLGVLAANGLMVAVAGVVVLPPFFGADKKTPHRPHEAPWQMLAGPLVLAGAGLVLGLFAQPLLGPIIASAVTGSLALDRAAELHLWAGFNLPLVLSGLTFAFGAVLFVFRAHFRDGVARVLARLPGFDSGWDHFLAGFRAMAAWQTSVIQTGSLTRYLAIVFAATALAIGGTVLAKRPVLMLDFSAPILLWMIAGVALAGAVLATSTGSRIAAIAGLGTVGIGVALVFILFGAPDVATTQLMVEALAAVMFAIAALRLPAIVESRSRGRRLVHAVIAGAVGLSLTLVLLGVAANPLDRFITTYFEEQSYALAHGLNIVNVVLVDFRAFDTFGELTVVLLAAIGAFAVLKSRAGDRS